MLKVQQIGHAGGAPEMRYTPNGTAVASVSVASNEVYTDKDSGEKKETTTWIQWTIWGKSAENFTKLVTKGRQLYIEGKVRNEKWQDKDTGEDRYRDRFVVTSWKLLDKKPGEADGGSGEDYAEPPSVN